MKSILRKTLVLVSTIVFMPFSQADVSIEGTDGLTLNAQVLETFDRPWAMTFLPNGQSLVSEKGGALWLLDKNGKKRFKVEGVPEVDMKGQGGLGDIIVHPDFKQNGLVFISYVERDPNDNEFSGAAVISSKLSTAKDSASLSESKKIWQQHPKVTGNGHYGHRLAIAPSGHLFITSGERQKFSPAQNMAMNLGKVIRINTDGSIPQDNPFYNNGPVTNEIWTLGHRNPLGIDFDADGKLWVHEMGPRNGDELNLIEKARNYGYPNVSEGEHYSGVKIPSHASMPIYVAPAASWVPAISPAGFIIYKGNKFADWKNDGLIGGLSSSALVRVEFTEHSKRPKYRAEEAARYEWGARVREVEQNSSGDIFILEDGDSGRLLKLSN